MDILGLVALRYCLSSYKELPWTTRVRGVNRLGNDDECRYVVTFDVADMSQQDQDRLESLLWTWDGCADIENDGYVLSMYLDH